MKSVITSLLTVYFMSLSMLAYAAERNGKVIDSTSGLSVSNSIVIEVTLGKNVNTRRTECVNIQSTVADWLGMYRFVADKDSPTDKKYVGTYTNLLAYKPGYMMDHSARVVDKDDIYLKKDSLPDEMRLRYLYSLLSSSECVNASNRKGLLTPYFKAIYLEAEQLSRVTGINSDLRKIQRRIASAWSPEHAGNNKQLDKVFAQKVERVLR